MAEKNTGVWLDKDTGKVVTKKPSRARQIVAPGHDIGPNEQALIDLHEANHDTFSAEQASVEPAVQPAPVKKAAAKKAPAARKSG